MGRLIDVRSRRLLSTFEPRRDLPIRKTQELTLCESGTLFRWQFLNGAVHPAQQLIVAEPVHMIVVMHRWLMIRQSRHGAIAIASLPDVIQGRIRCDLIQPGAIVRIALQPIVRTIGAEKCFLTEILCLSVVTHHAENVSKNLRLMAFHEVLEDRDFGHSTSLPVAFAVHLDMTRGGQFREVHQAGISEREPTFEAVNAFDQQTEILTFAAHLNSVQRSDTTVGVTTPPDVVRVRRESHAAQDFTR